MLPHHRQRGGRANVSRDDQDRVVGDIVGIVERAQLGPVDTGDVRHPPDDGPAIGVRLERERAHRLVDQPVQVVLRARPALLHHDLPLGVDRGGVEQEMPHPVRLEPEHEVELVGRDVRVVAGQVLRGVGIVAAAVLLDEARDLPAPVGGRPLEHHVLEEVGEPGRPGALVARAYR